MCRLYRTGCVFMTCLIGLNDLKIRINEPYKIWEIASKLIRKFKSLVIMYPNNIRLLLEFSDPIQV